MLANLQTHTVNVNRPTPTKGTSGAEKDSYTTVYSAMPCRVIDASASWVVFYSQRQITVTHQVFTNAGPTIRKGDRIAWGSRTLLVQGVVDLGGAGQVTRIDTQEIT